MVKRCHRLYSLPFAEVTSLKDGEEVVGGGARPPGIPPQPFDLLGLWVLQTAPGTLGLLTPTLPYESRRWQFPEIQFQGIKPCRTVY